MSEISNGVKPQDVEFKVVNDKVWVGTAIKPVAASTPPPQPKPEPTISTYTYDQAYALAIQNGTCQIIAQAGGSDSSAYINCINAVLQDYGYC